MEIDIKLRKNFVNQLTKLDQEYGREFFELNGLDDNQLSLTDFLDNFVKTSTVADSSVDSNANVGHKDMVTLMSEMSKPHKKLLAMHKIYLEINQKYGFKSANDWLRAEWTKALYMHDFVTASLLPYCYAYDITRLAEEGLFFLEGQNHESAKHLDTFIDFVKEFISYTSNRTSGACGLPNLIPYMYYFWDRDVKNDYYPRNKTPKQYAKQQIQRFIYAVNQPYVRDGIQSAFTNTSVFDKFYLEALFGGAVFPDGEFMVDELDGIMQFQKWFMEEMSEIRSKNMFTFPVSTMSFLVKEGASEDDPDFFRDDEFARWGIAHNMKWNDSNIFGDTSVNSLSNCCRLKSNITDLGYFNSIGGTSLRVGSVKVSTINLARIALEHHTEASYLRELKRITKINLKALDCQRDIIKKNIERGLLTNYADGLIDIKTQYSTIGVLGIYETMRSFDYTYQDEFGNTFYKPEAYEFGKKIFETIHALKEEFAADKDYMINLEAVPAEAAAVKMLKADKMLYPDTVIDDLPLYGNQFIPLGIKTTAEERIKIAAAFDSYCNGGSILHFNIDAPFNSFDKAYNMTKHIIHSGVSYFAFNTKISACKHNHAFYGDVCPECGEPVETQYTRIVGFLTPIKTWSKDRKEEFKLREWENINEN